MKIALFAFLMLLVQQSFSQQQTYTFNNGQFMKESDIRQAFEANKRLDELYHVLTPVIYHRVVKNDTVVNYLRFEIRETVVRQAVPEFKFVYQQDPIFLLLDKKLPGFKLRGLDGNEVLLNQFLGKPTLINFWATYCLPCITEMPQLSRLKERYKDKMNFISITEDDAIDHDLKNFLKDKDFNFDVLDMAEDYKKALKIGAIPKNLFLDKNGVLRYIQENYPIGTNSVPKSIDDESNFFTKIIEELIAE